MYFYLDMHVKQPPITHQFVFVAPLRLEVIHVRTVVHHYNLEININSVQPIQRFVEACMNDCLKTINIFNFVYLSLDILVFLL